MSEKEKRNYLAYFEGDRGAERSGGNFVRRDDASHKYEEDTPEYYEWWYFDAAFTNGYHIVITYHYRNFFLKPMIPSLQFFVYKPDGTRVDRYELCKPEDVSARPDWCDVTMNKSRILDKGDHYQVSMDINGDGFDLTFTNTVPPWKPGTGYNYKNEEEGLVAGWVVPMPGARVKGKILIKGETVEVEGHGYHDHNWGNYHCSKTFSGWYWGRIHHDRYTIDWGWVLPRRAGMPVASPLLIARDGKIELSTDRMDVQFGTMVKDEKLGKDYPETLHITSNALDVSMDLTIKTTRVVEQMELPKTQEWDMFYLRFLADYEMTVTVDGEAETVTGEMLHEYVIL